VKPYDQIKQDRLKAALDARPKPCGCAAPKPEPKPKTDEMYQGWVDKLAGILLKPDAD
jgi:hypothetical protein